MKARLRYEAAQVDRRYLDWHYPPNLPAAVKAMDLDSVEFKLPAEPLALIETSYRRTKPTSMTAEMARRMAIPSWLLVIPAPPEVPICGHCGRPMPYPPFTDNTPVSARRIWHPDGPLGEWTQTTLREWGRFLCSLGNRSAA